MTERGWRYTVVVPKWEGWSELPPDVHEEIQAQGNKVVEAPYLTNADEWALMPGLKWPKQVSWWRQRLASWLLTLAHKIDPWSSLG